MASTYFKNVIRCKVLFLQDKKGLINIDGYSECLPRKVFHRLETDESVCSTVREVHER